MICRVLIIDTGDLEGSTILGDVCARKSWQVERWNFEAVPARTLRSGVGVLVAVAVSRTNRALRLLEWLKKNPTPAPTLAVVPEATDSETLCDTIRVVDDFVLWPAHSQEIHFRIMRLLGGAIDSGPREEKTEPAYRAANLVGSDPTFLETLRQLPDFARSEAPVLITGETGTGKEICARAIHHLGPRRDRPFIPVDCASIPEHLFENELFGHVSGAYTDARSDQQGLVAMAEGGSLLLDEIDSMPLGVQAKLLRFLQEYTYKSLGAASFARSNVRIIAATNRPIEACMREGRFRGDLYFRLNVLRLELPPLRQRRGDIAALAQHFLSLLSPPTGQHKSFSVAALHKLAGYEWPGNVRELFNIVQRALVVSSGPQILTNHICLPTYDRLDEDVSEGFRAARQRNIESFERAYVENLLHKNQGNITRAAEAAHKDRRAFGRLVKKYGIARV